MEMPNNLTTRTFGPFVVTDTGRIIRKKASPNQNLDSLTTPQEADCKELCGWVLQNPTNTSGNAGTIKDGKNYAMRLDIQPSETGWSNTALQNNIKPKTKSNSYSSVLVQDSCYRNLKYEKNSNIGKALEYAHQQSLANRTIFEITTSQAAPQQQPVPQARTVPCSSTEDCTGQIPVAATIKSGASLMCPVCYQYQKV